MPDELGDRLERLPLPDSSEARERVARIAAEGSDLDASAATRSRHRPRRQSRWAAGIIAAIALVGLSLTPPGRAIAEGVGELVGIGGKSSLDHSKNENVPAAGAAVVIDAGTLPGSDQPYEITAYRSREPKHDLPRRHDVPTRPIPEQSSRASISCISLDLPGIENLSQAEFSTICVDAEESDDYTLHASGFSEDTAGTYGEAARFRVSGSTSEDVAEVEVTYVDPATGNRIKAPVIYGRLAGTVAEQIDAPARFGHFIAFIPDDGIKASLNRGGLAAHPFVETIEVRAFDDAGEQITVDRFGQDLAKLERRARRRGR